MKVKNTALINFIHYAICWILVFPLTYILIALDMEAKLSLFLSNTIGILACLIITTIYKKNLIKNSVPIQAKVKEVKFWGSQANTTFEINSKKQVIGNLDKLVKKGETKELLYNEKKNEYYNPDLLTLMKTKKIIIGLVISIILTTAAIFFQNAMPIEETEIFITIRFMNAMLLLLAVIGGKTLPYYLNKKNLIEVIATTQSKAVREGNEVVKQTNDNFTFEFEGETFIYLPLNPPSGKNFDEIYRTLYFKKDGTMFGDKAEIQTLLIFGVIWMLFYLIGITTIIFSII